MKLDRNITKPRRGKYALVLLRVFDQLTPNRRWVVLNMFAGVKEAGLIDFGDTQDTDFFVIRLKDKYAAPALHAYAAAARVDDPEYADEIVRLAIAAENHPSKRKPD